MKRGSHQIIVGDCLAELAKLPAGTSTIQGLLF